MKIIISVLLLVLFSNSIDAQIKKKQWMIGGVADFSYSDGDASINNTSNGNSKSSSYTASASPAYFFIDKLCAGLRIGAGGAYAKEKYFSSFGSYSSKSKVNSINLSPFIRYYLLDVSKKINLFADASYTYSHGRSETDVEQVFFGGGIPSTTQSHSEYKFNSNSYSIAAGPAFFLNTKVSLELFLKYSHSKINKNNQSGNIFGAGAGFQVHLGK